MEMDLNDANFMFAVKPEPTEIANLTSMQSPCFNHNVAINWENADNSVKINEVVKLHLIGIVPNDVKIKLDLGDERETSNSLSGNIEEHDDKTHKCEICSKNVASKRAKSLHMKTHTAQAKYRCEFCDKRFTQNIYLKQHVQIHTENFQCAICGKCCRTNYDLSRHLQIHTGERTDKCEVCDKYFVTRQNLLNHMKIHAREIHLTTQADCNIFWCKICSKLFVSRYKLSRHVKYHSSPKTFQCEICNKCFKTSNRLSHHLKIHTGEKTEQCGICGRYFITGQHMLNHVKKHEHERMIKKYRCETCDESFVMEQSLLKHMRRYKCKICNVHFTQKTLLDHKKTHMRNSEEKFLLKYPYNRSIDDAAKQLVKKESALCIIQVQSTIDSDARGRKPAMSTNESHVGAATENESQSTGTLNLWKILNDEILIKDEINHSDPVIDDVKQEF